MHVAMIQAGEIQAVIGDASRNGMGGTQYSGIWSLTSRHWPFNAFGNSYAGLIPGEIRGRSPELIDADDRSCVLARQADDAYPVDARAEYRVEEPYYLDHVFVCRDRSDVRAPGCGFREVSWCSYMNVPDDPRLHFLSRGEWHRYLSPRHGVGANIAPSFLPDEDLEVWPVTSDWREGIRNDRPFHWDRYERRFDEPFYYGRLGPMVLILIFDDPCRLRFFCSPTGGGMGLRPGQTCPAWDFEWIIPEREYDVGQEYRFRVRLVYKRFVSDADVLDEVRNTQVNLGFSRPPGS